MKKFNILQIAFKTCKLQHQPFCSIDGGRCVAFNPEDDTTFLVGTDEGVIYKCTTEYSSKFLQTYVAHTTPIYNIAWNSYVPTIFLTCSAEWIIKIWDHKGQ